MGQAEFLKQFLDALQKDTPIDALPYASLSGSDITSVEEALKEILEGADQRGEYKPVEFVQVSAQSNSQVLPEKEKPAPPPSKLLSKIPVSKIPGQDQVPDGDTPLNVDLSEPGDPPLTQKEKNDAIAAENAAKLAVQQKEDEEAQIQFDGRIQAPAMEALKLITKAMAGEIQEPITAEAPAMGALKLVTDAMAGEIKEPITAEAPAMGALKLVTDAMAGEIKEPISVEVPALKALKLISEPLNPAKEIQDAPSVETPAMKALKLISDPLNPAKEIQDTPSVEGPAIRAVHLMTRKIPNSLTVAIQSILTLYHKIKSSNSMDELRNPVLQQNTDEEFKQEDSGSEESGVSAQETSGLTSQDESRQATLSPESGVTEGASPVLEESTHEPSSQALSPSESSLEPSTEASVSPSAPNPEQSLEPSTEASSEASPQTIVSSEKEPSEEMKQILSKIEEKITEIKTSSDKDKIPKLEDLMIELNEKIANEEFKSIREKLEKFLMDATDAAEEERLAQEAEKAAAEQARAEEERLAQEAKKIAEEQARVEAERVAKEAEKARLAQEAVQELQKGVEKNSTQAIDDLNEKEEEFDVSLPNSNETKKHEMILSHIEELKKKIADEKKIKYSDPFITRVEGRIKQLKSLLQPSETKNPLLSGQSSDPVGNENGEDESVKSASSTLSTLTTGSAASSPVSGSSETPNPMLDPKKTGASSESVASLKTGSNSKTTATTKSTTSEEFVARVKRVLSEPTPSKAKGSVRTPTRSKVKPKTQTGLTQNPLATAPLATAIGGTKKIKRGKSRKISRKKY